MSVRAALIALARGERTERLLGACRLHWGHAEAFGHDAVRELFRTSPLDLADATWVETPYGAALIAAETALVADLYDGQIGRLWRIGAGDTPEPEPFVAVAFDPDLHQERGGIFARREDHAEVSAAAFGALVAGGQVLCDLPGAHRARGFLLRAFGDDARSAGLFAVHSLSAGVVRAAGFAHALVLIEAGSVRQVSDPVRTRDWTPRL